jgi:ribosomal-protein-alanine N-acetyltransferase
LNLEICPLNENDYAIADAVFDSAFGRAGSRVSEMAFLQALQPHGRFIARLDGKPVGLVGMIDYGRVAYIGSLAVLPEHQGHGIGRALMEHIIARVKARGPRIMLLEATPAGAHIYPKLGFGVDGTTHGYRLKTTAPRVPSPVAARPMQVEDIAEVAALDEPIFGDNRARVLKAYLELLPGRAFVVRAEQGQLSGYLFAHHHRLGPWAARRPQDAETLLLAALALPFEQGPTVVMPSSNISGTRLVERYRFTLERSMLHMRLGGDGPPGQRSSLYALATPGIG